MCGFAGIFAYSPDAPCVDGDELLRIRERMFTRGPDGSGLWLSHDGLIGLAHRRLAIIDLSETGAQPMFSADGGLGIVFNGEIYNYREIRAGLEARGYRFHSTSDTEVLLHLYDEKGEDMLHDLRGMYAFAIWDQRKQGLFLARDPFGIKPLYLSDDGKTIRIASQVKALLAGGQVDTSPEPAGHVGFFLWGHVPEPYTLYKGISALPAGSSLWVSRSTRPASHTSGFKPHTFCSISTELAHASQGLDQLDTTSATQRIRQALSNSVQQHLIADVPVGVFLSAGLDSTMLAALVAEQAPRDLHTVTLGFEEYLGTENDEAPIAEQVAARLGANHRTIRVRRSDFQEELQNILDAMDQPSIDGVNSYFVSKAAAQAGLKVALSGLGGDELFGSYPGFRQIPRLVKLCGGVARIPGLGKTIRLATAPFLKCFTSPKYSGLFEYGPSFGGAYLLRRAMYMPWELKSMLDADMLQAGLRELRTVNRLDDTIAGVACDHHKVSALEMSCYMRGQLLRDTDWASMAHSLEVRVPFLDLDLLRTTAPVLGRPTSPDKRSVAVAVGNLPDAVTNRLKTGFVVPVREWMAGDVAAGSRGVRGWSHHVYKKLHSSGSILSKKKSGQPTILVFRIGQLGDTLVAMPAIYAIRKKHPFHRLVLLTEKHKRGKNYVSSWDILEPTGWFDDVIFYYARTKAKETFQGLFHLIPALRSLRCTHVYDLTPERTARQHLRDSFFFRCIIGIANFQGFLPSAKPGKTFEEITRVEPEWHRLLTIVGKELEQQSFKLPIPEQFRNEANKVLGDNGIDNNDCLIAIGPGSKMPAKLWPKEKFADLGHRILNQFPFVSLVVLGGQEDHSLGDYLCTQLGPRTHNFAGKLSIYGSAAVLEKCAFYLGNDSGTMHLAAMTGAPCVAIFSARDYPGKWEPYGENHIIHRRHVECALCMQQVCDRGENACVNKVTVHEVFENLKNHHFKCVH